MTDFNLDHARQSAAEFRRLQEAATAGPWESAMCACQTEKHTYTHEVLGPIDFDAQSRESITGIVMLRRDTEFIAHARNSDVAAQLEAACAEVERLRTALRNLEAAADPFAADQSRAPDPRCGLVQPVTVADCEALTAAIRAARCIGGAANGR